MVDDLFFCATLTGRRGGHTLFVQAGAEKPDTGAEAVKPGPGSSCEGHTVPGWPVTRGRQHRTSAKFPKAFHEEPVPMCFLQVDKPFIEKSLAYIQDFSRIC